MSKRPALSVLFVLLALAASGSNARRIESAGPDTGFIAGTWRGGDGETLIEEIWSVGESGRMLGMFRMMSGAEIRFYELMSIEPLDDGWVMYLRHFGPGLEAWEDETGALVFDLVEAGEGRAVFDQRGAETRLIYERTGERLKVTLEKFVDGEWDRTPFEYVRE